MLNDSISKSNNAYHSENWLRSKMAILFYRYMYKRELLNVRIVHSFLMSMDSDNMESDIMAYIRKGLFMNYCHCEKTVSIYK